MYMYVSSEGAAIDVTGGMFDRVYVEIVVITSNDKLIYTTFTNFSMKYLVMCMVYTDDGGIK